ncbi:MAG: hypothetical protein ACLUOS_10745 [Odoribacter splanchnicus]
MAEMDKSEPIIRPDSLQLMAAQLDERGVTDTVTLPVREIIGKIAGKEQVFYRQVQAVEDMDLESDESGSADILSEPVAMAVTNEAARQAFDSCVLKPAALRRKQPITGYAVTLPKADTQKKDKKKKNDADAVGTKSVYLDSLMLEKNTRKERRTRIVHTKSIGAGERKFRQEVVIDHAGWMKNSTLCSGFFALSRRCPFGKTARRDTIDRALESKRFTCPDQTHSTFIALMQP